MHAQPITAQVPTLPRIGGQQHRLAFQRHGMCDKPPAGIECLA
jgi:hypothetical protein